MIYAPHPLADSTGVLSKKIKKLGVDLASPTQYPSKIPLWEAADVIIGATSGVFTLLACTPFTSIVVTRRLSHCNLFGRQAARTVPTKLLAYQSKVLGNDCLELTLILFCTRPAEMCTF